MSILDKIKSDVKKSGRNKSNFIYFREGEKKRIRFLTDMEDGMEVVFHDSFERNINEPCQETYGNSCELCEDEDLRTRSNYVWTVWDYDENKPKLLMAAVSRCSPVPALVAFYETYGTLCDRDYVVTVTGKQTSKTFNVVPMDKVKFRNNKAKPFSDQKILKMLSEAFPHDGDDDEPVRKKSKHDDDYDEQDDYDNEWDDEGGNSYSDMKPQELYKLCQGRGIEAEKKKSAKYYINLLEEDDAAQDDWGNDDEWEEDDD